MFVHLAAYVPEDTARNTPEDAVSTLRANVLGTINLVKALNDAPRLSSLVYASTFEVYGTPQQLPIDEDHSTHPVGYYGASKLAAEKYLSLFNLDQGVPVCTLRLSTIYGPGDHLKRAVGNFVRAAARGGDLVIYGDGLDLRDLVYVKDAAEAVVQAIQKRFSCVLNIASGTGYSIKQVADTVLRVARVENLFPRLMHQERLKPRMDYVMRIDSARKILGWQASTSLEEGIRAQLKWMKESGK
jgi:UDP-glucose 4-epimerase